MQCLYCKKSFSPSRSTQKYCQNVCQRRAKASRSYYKHGKGFGTCLHCNKKFKKTRSNQKYCSTTCVGGSNKKYLSTPDCLEKAESKIDKYLGYVRVYAPMHPMENTWGYVYEHRLIMEEYLNRFLTKTEVVHHKNGLRWDNRLSNLELMDVVNHGKLMKYGGQRPEDIK